MKHSKLVVRVRENCVQCVYVRFVWGQMCVTQWFQNFLLSYIREWTSWEWSSYCVILVCPSMLSSLIFSFAINLWLNKIVASSCFQCCQISPYCLQKHRGHYKFPPSQFYIPTVSYQVQCTSKKLKCSDSTSQYRSGNDTFSYKNTVEPVVVSSYYRRFFLWSMAVVAAAAPCTRTSICAASPDPQRVLGPTDRDNKDSTIRQGKDYGYVFHAPSNFRLTRKPIQTHLDELNWEPLAQDGPGESKSSIMYGITVDPVRINSLTEFGTPEQVAARVVTAELNRDGVLEVTLDRASSYTDANGLLYYVIDYVSDGKRGLKRFLTRTCITDLKLYVVTAQIKEAEYQKNEQRREELDGVLNSFLVVGPSKTP